MRGIRCVILLETMIRGGTYGGPYYIDIFTGKRQASYCNHYRDARVYGSHSEAKKELACWIDAYPNAKIIDESDI